MITVGRCSVIVFFKTMWMRIASLRGIATTSGVTSTSFASYEDFNGAAFVNTAAVVSDHLSCHGYLTLKCHTRVKVTGH